MTINQATLKTWHLDNKDGPSHEICQSLLNMVNQDEFTCLDTKQDVYRGQCHRAHLKNL